MRRSILASTLALAFASSAGSAPTTFAGKNGLIAFTRLGAPCGVFKVEAQCAEAIWVSTVDGAKLKQMTRPKRKTDAHRHPTWSPDGSRIAYVANSGAPTRYYELWVVNADGSGNRKVLDYRRGGFDLGARPTWSSTGKELLFEDNNRIRAVNVATGKLRTIAGLPGTASGMQVSPNGKLVAYVAGASNSVWVKPLNGSARTRLAPVFGGAYFGWSPDSTRIVYIADCMQLATISARGGRPTVVYSEAGSGSCWPDPVWSPDGTTILFWRSLRPPEGSKPSTPWLTDRFSAVRTDGSQTRVVGPGSGGCEVFSYNPETRTRTPMPCEVSYPSWQSAK